MGGVQKKPGVSFQECSPSESLRTQWKETGRSLSILVHWRPQCPGFLLGTAHISFLCLASTKIPDFQKKGRFLGYTILCAQTAWGQ